MVYGVSGNVDSVNHSIYKIQFSFTSYLDLRLNRDSEGQLRTKFRACGSYDDFLDRGLLLIKRLLN